MVIEPFEGDDLKISETVLMIAQPCEYNLGHQIGWNGKFYVIYFTFLKAYLLLGWKFKHFL